LFAAPSIALLLMNGVYPVLNRQLKVWDWLTGEPDTGNLQIRLDKGSG